MRLQNSNSQLVSKLLFRLLPIQILLAAVGFVNGIVSSLFASNYVGVQAMSAVQLYSPVQTIFVAINLMLTGGSQILCGQYMGKNQMERTRSVFSLDILIAIFISAVTIVVLFAGAVFDLTRVVTSDSAVRPLLNEYILGQVIGILPLMLGQQLAAFLSLEKQTRRTLTASLVFIAVNLVLNYLFVAVMELGAFGLALASSLGLWVFFLVQAQYYVTGKALIRFGLTTCRLSDIGEIIHIGLPGSLSQGYQTLRMIIVNQIVPIYVGSVGLSAFGAANMLLGLFWAIPNGMLAVSRMLMSISIGEEDRQTLVDVMRNMLRKFVPLMFAISVLVVVCAVPLTKLYYQDPSDPVFLMTVYGFRILPLCMPLSVICMHFVCYGQASNKQVLVHLLSVLDGVVCVAGFTAVLLPFIGINGLYIANVLNGVVTTIVIVAYAWIRSKSLPTNMDALMVIPEDFGVSEHERMDLSLRSMEEVMNISHDIQTFCLERGIDERRAYLSGLFMEEMAGNVIEHGFTQDKKKHSVDVRVAHKGDHIILRMKDDCTPFDPAQRQAVVDPEDVTKNIGIRMVYSIAESIHYQSILGLNVLTIRI